MDLQTMVEEVRQALLGSGEPSASPSPREMALQDIGRSVEERLEDKYRGHKTDAFRTEPGKHRLSVYATGRETPFYSVELDRELDAMHIDTIRTDGETAYPRIYTPPFRDAVRMVEEELVNSNLPYSSVEELEQFRRAAANH